MEDTDISSHCSEISQHSEFSNISTSSLSIYKTEFLELQNELNGSNYQSVLSDHLTSSSPLEGYSILHGRQNRNMPNFFEGASGEREQKNSHHLENKLELKFHSQIERLLRNKSQLEAQLESANNQISRLLDTYNTSGTNEISVLEGKIIRLENDNRHLYTENARLLSELGTSKSDGRELEGKLNNINSALDEYKSLVNIRDVCIEKLKVKISQQCVEMQKCVQTNHAVSHALESTKSDLEHSIKSETWHREQLSVSQDQKKQLLEELSEQKNITSCYLNHIDQLNIELDQFRNKYEQSQLEIIRNRQDTLRLNNVSESMRHDSPLPVFSGATCLTPSIKINTETQNLCRQYQQTIKELAIEMRNIQETVSESQITIKQRNKENSELTAQCIKLQKVLQSKVNEIEHLETKVKNLTTKLSDNTSEINVVNKEVLNVRAENHKLKVELLARNNEREIIDNTVSEIRDNFTKLKVNYEKLKEEISLKDKHIINLETEKQELFMNNNWKVCELERIKNNDCLIGKLEEQLKMMESEKCELCKSKTDILERYDEQRSMLQQELDNLKTLFLKTEDRYTNEISDLLKKLAKYEEVIAKYEVDISMYQNDVDNFKINLKAKDITQIEKRCQFTQNLARLLFAQFNNGSKVELNIVDIQNIITKSLRDDSFEIGHNTSDSNTFDIASGSSERCGASLSWSESLLCTNSDTSNTQPEIDTFGLISSNHIESKNHCLENIRKLQALLQVKEMEKKHLQNRYETNNRTLLRKVKEHMKGCRAAEKLNARLQSCCNSLSHDINIVKIHLLSKEEEIALLREQLENLRSPFKTLKSPDKHSVDYNDSHEDNGEGNSVKYLTKDVENMKQENILKHQTIEQLKVEVQTAQFNAANACDEKNNITKELQSKNSEISRLKKELVKLKSKLVSKEQENIKLKTQSDLWKSELQQASTENKKLREASEKCSTDIEYLKKEVESMNKDISQKYEQLKQLKQEKDLLQEKLNQQNTNNSQSFNTDEEIGSSELNSLRNEKFFLQRLCKDLQAALRSNINQNMALKERISNLSREQQFSSLPNILPSLCVPNKLDEDYIKKLLKKNNTRAQPLSDIQECLESLKKEVFTLRKQVEEDTCKSRI